MRFQKHYFDIHRNNIFASWFIAILLSLTIVTPIFAHSPTPSASPTIIENKGQWADFIRYRCDIPGGALFFENNRLTYNLFDNSILKKLHEGAIDSSAEAILKFHAFRVNFVGANAMPKIGAENPQEEYFNYYLGKDPKRWASGVRGYSKVNYNGLYQNIDLDVYYKGKNLKYDFVVQPHGATENIQLQYEDASGLRIENGQLVVSTSLGEIREKKPFAYQIIHNKIVYVPCEFAISGNTVHFEFPTGYNKNEQLIIDPELIFSTYSGSFADNFGYTATFDSEGFLYAAGTAFYIGYPVTVGAFQTNFKGGDTLKYSDGSIYNYGVDIGITKYDTTGRKRIYSTYLGGTGSEMPHSLVVDQNDDLYILGTTSSVDFPVSNGALDKSFNKGSPIYFDGLGVLYVNGCDLFISKLVPDGTALIASTYLGGSKNDGVNFVTNSLRYNYADEVRGEIDIDRDNNVFIATCTNSSDFPIIGNTFQKQYAGGNLDAVVVKLTPALDSIIWSTYLGGSVSDAAYSLALDTARNIIIAGGSNSKNLPFSKNLISSPLGGRADGFIAKLSPDGKKLVHGTYMGTADYDQIYFVETDYKNNTYVFGQCSNSGTAYIKNALYFRNNSGQFVSKINATLDTIIWSTSFGNGSGKPNISPTAFLVDLCNKIYLSGWGGKPFNGDFLKGNLNIPFNMDITADAFQKTTDNQDFYLMVLEDDASKLSYASYFGGNKSDEHVDGGTSRFDRKGKIYQSVCAGCGQNSDFPIYPNPGAVSSTNNSDNCNNAVLKFNFKLPIVVADFKASECNPIAFRNLSLTQNATTYDWSFGDGSKSSEKEPKHLYNKAGNFKVRLIIRDLLTCNLVDSITKTVYISPLSLGVNATADEYTIYKGLGTTLHAQPNSGYLYSWTPINSLSNPTNPNPFAKPTDTTTYQLRITDSKNNCEYTDSVTINVIELICDERSIYVPNAFTPNQDDKNEKVLVRSEVIESMFFTIYNRWGEKVFETKNQLEGWDGTYKGRQADPDVYVYYLEGTCLDKTDFLLKGNITLIK